MIHLKSFFLGIIFLIIVCIAYIVIKNNRTVPAGVIILLNGPSASGKSSIQKAFQKIMMPDLWIKQGIDSLFDISFPDINLENLEYWQSKNPMRWVLKQ